jgi:hypothetical protein
MFHPDIRLQETICSHFDIIFSWVPGLSRYRGYSFELTNFASRTLNITASLIIGKLLFLSNKKENYFLFFLLFVTVFANCLTSSKGGLGAFLVMMFFIILFSTRLNKYPIRNSLFFLFGFISIFILSGVFVSTFGEAFHVTTIDTSESNVSLSTRLEYWKAGFNALSRENSFITGLGLGGYEYFSKSTVWPHNIYFSFFFDFGLAGIMFLLSIFSIIIKYCFKIKLFIYQKTYHQHMALSLFGGLIAIGVHGLVEFYYNQSIFWVYLAILFATFKFAANESSCND